MLAEKALTGAEASEAAAEITAMADDFARRRVASTFRANPWYHAVSKLAVGPVGNLVQPGLGTSANGALKVLRYTSDREDRRVGGWAAFVVTLRR
jgi:hypothetical protein